MCVFELLLRIGETRFESSELLRVGVGSGSRGGCGGLLLRLSERLLRLLELVARRADILLKRLDRLLRLLEVGPRRVQLDLLTVGLGKSLLLGSRLSVGELLTQRGELFVVR